MQKLIEKLGDHFVSLERRKVFLHDDKKITVYVVTYFCFGHHVRTRAKVDAIDALLCANENVSKEKLNGYIHGV